MTRTGLALLIAVLAALAAAAPTASATFLGKPGPIVFYDLDGGSGLWIIGPNGGNVQKAPFNESHDPRRSAPAYSADGRFVAYPSTDGLYVAAADGSDARRVVDSNAYHPAWSPDGRRIVFTRRSEDGYPMLHVLDLATGAIRFLTPGESPSWSPNGKLIAYDKVGDSGLCKIRPDGRGRGCFSGARKLGAHDPDWSPGGRAIAVAARDRIAVLRSDGRFDRWISPRIKRTSNVPILVFEPSWSPDGRRVVYERGKGQYRGSLYVTADRGGRQRFLTTGIDPVWSPRR